MCVRVCVAGLPLKQLGTVRGTIHCEVNASTRVVPSTVYTHSIHSVLPAGSQGRLQCRHTHTHTHCTPHSYRLFACVGTCLPVFACVTVATMHNRRKQQSVTHGTVCLHPAHCEWRTRALWPTSGMHHGWRHALFESAALRTHSTTVHHGILCTPWDGGCRERRGLTAHTDNRKEHRLVLATTQLWDITSDATGLVLPTRANGGGTSS